MCECVYVREGQSSTLMLLEDSGLNDCVGLSLLDWSLGPRTVFIPSSSPSPNLSLTSSAPIGDSPNSAGPLLPIWALPFLSKGRTTSEHAKKWFSTPPRPSYKPLESPRPPSEGDEFGTRH